jgi:hypothetical protein
MIWNYDHFQNKKLNIHEVCVYNFKFSYLFNCDEQKKVINWKNFKYF